MKTLNISVTKEQAKTVDRLVVDQGYANRSEFFRMILRSFTANKRQQEFDALLSESRKSFQNFLRQKGYNPSQISKQKAQELLSQTLEL